MSGKIPLILKFKMRVLDINQSSLAAKLCINKEKMSRIVNGKTIPSYSLVKRIAMVLKIRNDVIYKAIKSDLFSEWKGQRNLNDEGIRRRSLTHFTTRYTIKRKGYEYSITQPSNLPAPTASRIMQGLNGEGKFTPTFKKSKLHGFSEED